MENSKAVQFVGWQKKSFFFVSHILASFFCFPAMFLFSLQPSQSPKFGGYKMSKSRRPLWWLYFSPETQHKLMKSSTTKKKVVLESDLHPKKGFPKTVSYSLATTEALHFSTKTKTKNIPKTERHCSRKKHINSPKLPSL